MGEIQLWKVMFGNKVREAEKFEKVLDCVLALHNLNILMKHDENFVLPEVRAPIHGAHLFKQKKELKLKIPAAPTPQMLRKSPQIAKFQDFMRTTIAQVRKWLQIGGQWCLFSPTIGKRGENLFKGGYCLQLRL